MKISLKTAFRYRNVLSSLLNNVEALLTDSAYIYTVKETHLRRKQNPDAEDQTIEDTLKSRRSYPDLTAEKLISLLDMITAEIERLDCAVHTAKASLTFNIDAAVQTNKTKRNQIAILERLASAKSSSTTDSATDYKLNANGEQVRYLYPVESVQTINYDRNKIVAKRKQLLSSCDALSEKIDQAMVAETVEFSPRWDASTTFEELIDLDN